ncbi:GtrA family protein [Baekduia alba]|uniref:GtrA family protein n=1 Tax=Baekduia alba TaxID=2997333 RepID=UPI0023407F01|nr:GtrA family protein [Baekduia alba]
MSDALDRLRRRDRVRHGVRDADNWWQLARFTAVGASGYVVNLITFALCVHALDLDFRVAAVIAFLVAVTNNFWWNRHWTFEAGAGHAGQQAVRFLVVSVAAFAVNFVVLEALVTGADVKELLAQAIAVAAATPCNFVGNKLWTFDE